MLYFIWWLLTVLVIAIIQNNIKHYYVIIFVFEKRNINKRNIYWLKNQINNVLYEI